MTIDGLLASTAKVGTSIAGHVVLILYGDADGELVEITTVAMTPALADSIAVALGDASDNINDQRRP
jgi:DNA-binding protein YbaB